MRRPSAVRAISLTRRSRSEGVRIGEAALFEPVDDAGDVGVVAVQEAAISLIVRGSSRVRSAPKAAGRRPSSRAMARKGGG